MIDPKILKDNPDTIREMLRKRNLLDFPIDNLFELDGRRRKLIASIQERRQKKNNLSELVAQKKQAKENAEDELNEMKDLGRKLNDEEVALSAVQESFNDLILRLPNLLDDSVPEGKDEKSNVIVRKVGKPRDFKFRPKDHVDLATKSGFVDLERAGKISGARFYFLRNELVKLNQALINFALDFLSESEYELLQPPFMIRRKPMEGAVILGDFEDVIYKIDSEDLYMIGTSEHAIASMHMDEILEGQKLPLRYAGFSPCFRKEAGAHGKDMKGIFRVHQFEKVEQFVFCKPEDSRTEHESILSLTEKFLRELDIPYRLMLLSSGDTGKISSKTYDIEAWMAGQVAYREIISCSNCLDYQSRRLSIRYRDRTNEDTRYVHTLNSTLVATERMMVSIMENYQNQDGTITIPTVLRKYMGNKTILGSGS